MQYLSKSLIIFFPYLFSLSFFFIFFLYLFSFIPSLFPMENKTASDITPEMIANLQAELAKLREEKEAAEQAAKELNLQLASKDLAVSKKVKTIILDGKIYECYTQKFINPTDGNTYLVDDCLATEAGRDILRTLIKRGSQSFRYVNTETATETTTEKVGAVTTPKARK